MYRPKKIPSEAKIRRFIRRIVFGKNIFCPQCRSRQTLHYQDRYRCQGCRCKFSLLSHTWLSNMKLPLTQFWIILWCWTAQIPIQQAMAIAGLSNKAVRYWYASFRQHLPQDKVLLEAMVQLDEAYFSGFQGCTLLMAKQKGTRKLAFKLLPEGQPNRMDALMFLRQNVKPGSVLYTDGFSIYTGIDRLFPVTHLVDSHKDWQYSGTSEIEGVFGNLRTFIRRMYHHVTVKKLENVVSEFCYRFSHPEMFENPRYYLENTLTLVPTG